MIKKITFNVALLIFTLFLPLYFLYLQKEVSFLVGTMWFGLPFLGSALMTFLNNKYRKQDLHHRWLWIIFMIIGVLGLCYSGFVLFVLFLYRNCCGF